jgi:hypothetical protein
MLGHTTLTMLVTRYYGYVPNLVRQDGALLSAQLDRRRARPVAKTWASGSPAARPVS